MLRIDHIAKQYKDTPVLRDIDLLVEGGEFVSLLGPSGCGKTTLLRAVAGLEPVSGGQIRIAQQVVGSAAHSVPPEQRRIGMVFQDYALFPHLSVGRNVAFGIHQLPKAEQAARVAEVLQRLLREDVSIRNMKLVLETLAQWGQREKDVILLVEHVRGALARYISARHAVAGSLPVIVLSSTLEDRIRAGIRQGQGAAFLNLDPSDAAEILDRFTLNVGEIATYRPGVVLMVAPDIRRFVKRFIENRLPARYHAPDMLCRALDMNFGLIHHIPGRLVDEEVFAHARALCPDEALWAQLTTAHGRGFRQASDRGEYLDCAEDCWAVFWDEPLILAEIANDGYHLFPFEIPAAKYTQKIADAAFARDPIHLRSIPRAFITPQMAERFAREYADMLHDVPLPLRTARVCQTAAEHSWDDGKYFRHVPLALRGVRFRPSGATALLRRNMLVYGLGGVLLPFAAIKAIDLLLVLVFGA